MIAVESEHATIPTFRATSSRGESMGDATSYIHESAFVEGGAEVGRGTRVWHNAHIRTGAVIGNGCSLGKNVFIDAGVHIGDRVKIQNNVSVYRGVTLDHDVFVGPSAVFTNDRYPRAHDTDWEVVDTRVRTGASIGANATIVCGVEIGMWATIAAGALVAKNVEPNQLVVGHPARPMGWVCWCGRIVSREVARPRDGECANCGRRLGEVG
jgi:UDP-3-O-[3-hydroxymyristoyl] glucosamine N-acyltransferase